MKVLSRGSKVIKVFLVLTPSHCPAFIVAPIVDDAG